MTENAELRILTCIETWAPEMVTVMLYRGCDYLIPVEAGHRRETSVGVQT